MTVRVPLDELPQACEQVGAICFLLTTNEDGTPHPAHVRVNRVGSQFELSVGRRSWHNCGRDVAVTLLWPADAAHSDAMSLLVDGTVRQEAENVEDGGGSVRVTPTSAIWHRRPGQPGC